MESLGKKLQEARLRKKISIEEASRVTKIRASRLQEIENEDFSSFSSLAYAKGFLLIYGKYLEVDVTPYLDAFETSREVSVDGYSYLQEAPNTSPLPVVRRQPRRRPTLMPFIIAVGVLILGLYLVKLLLDIQRIAPGSNAPNAAAVASVTPTPSPEKIVAPRAIPVGTPPSEAQVTSTPAASPVETAAAVSTTPRPTEPEVRRAVPVHPEDVVSPPPNDRSGGANQIDIKPRKLTYVRVKLDGNPQPVFADWLDANRPPLSFRARHITVRVLDRSAVEITKNGAALALGDEAVTFE
jgi:cytoskeletal protein RodZ